MGLDHAPTDQFGDPADRDARLGGGLGDGDVLGFVFRRHVASISRQRFRVNRVDNSSDIAMINDQ